ncbi:MAG: hypothetical protein HAW67_06885 [Endozoicomonadaceae bacterium]|nr:hypothetical protein [Endozoicomonadaceae bacterium]
MKLLPSRLSVARNLPVDTGQNQFNMTTAKTVFRRDNTTCRFCGWKEISVRQLRIVSTSSEYLKDLPSSKMATSCSLCELVHRLGKAEHLNYGQLAYLPEFTQADVIHLARSAYFIMNDDSVPEMHELLECLQEFLNEERIPAVPIHLDINKYTFRDFSLSLQDLPEKQYQQRHIFLKNLRFWPNLKEMKNLIGNDLDKHLVNYPIQSWKASLQKLGIPSNAVE